MTLKTIKKRSRYVAGGLALVLVLMLAIVRVHFTGNFEGLFLLKGESSHFILQDDLRLTGMAAFDEKTGLPGKPSIKLDHNEIQRLIEQSRR